MAEDHDGEAHANLLSAHRSGVLEGEGGVVVRGALLFQPAFTSLGNAYQRVLPHRLCFLGSSFMECLYYFAGNA